MSVLISYHLLYIISSGIETLLNDLVLLFKPEHLFHWTTIPPHSSSDHLNISLNEFVLESPPANPTKSGTIQQTGTKFSLVTILMKQQKHGPEGHVYHRDFYVLRVILYF